ncbi:hypothetical protein Taro_029070 [Colocasia esculenta]|uniref:Uncharacterized protein n=1 Tax=Colocasia esculenta TaxID=4460 RepID=A0A843VCW5_COLES|nr:hypothetical protein [Colocasia esculenta]
MAPAWDNISDSDSESNSSSEVEEEANLAFMANTEEKVTSDSSFDSCNDFYSDRVKCVDTVHGRVDTRPSFQEIHLSDWDSVSTQSVIVSTLDPISRRPFLRKWDNRVKCVDTVHGRVDTRPSFQEIYLSDWDSVSTQSVVVSTLDPVSRRPFLSKWDSVSTHPVVVSTHSG